MENFHFTLGCSHFQTGMKDLKVNFKNLKFQSWAFIQNIIQCKWMIYFIPKEKPVFFQTTLPKVELMK